MFSQKDLARNFPGRQLSATMIPDFTFPLAYVSIGGGDYFCTDFIARNRITDPVNVAGFDAFNCIELRFHFGRVNFSSANIDKRAGAADNAEIAGLIGFDEVAGGIPAVRL